MRVPLRTQHRLRGGMASVIAMLVTHNVGTENAIAVPTWVPGSHISLGLLAARAAAMVLRLPRSAAVHIHMSEGGSFLRETLIVAAARCRRLPRIITIHGPGFADFSARRPRLVGAVLRMASAVTVLSDTDLAAVRRLAPGVHAEILPNPMPLDLAADPVANTSEVVLFAGEVGLRKGADVLSRAWEQLLSVVHMRSASSSAPPLSCAYRLRSDLRFADPSSPIRSGSSFARHA